MVLLGELAALCLVISGFLIILGSRFGYRLLYGTLVLVILVPLCVGLLRGLAASVATSVGSASCSTGSGSIPVVLLLALIVWAFVRFIIHRRRLRTFLGRSQTSLKRRVDRS